MFTPPPKPTTFFHGTTEWENESGVGSVCSFGDIFVCILFFWGGGFVGGLFVVYF